MELSLKPTQSKQNLLLWALLFSIMLHVLLVIVIPKIKFENTQKETVLKIELVPKPIPKVVEPPKPLEPTKPIKPIEPPKPIKQKPTPTKPEPQQKPLEKTPEAPKPIPQNSIESAPTPIITATAKPDVKPVITAPPAPPPDLPKPVDKAPSQDDIDAAKSTFRENVLNELKRNHRYPKLAEMRGLQGEAKVEIKLDKQGNVISATIVESSGESILDEGALATVKRSNIKQFMKEILFGHIQTITVPISFTLNNN